MKFKKPGFWKNINILALLLLPLSFLTLIFNIIKELIITEKKFDIPIICVGNFFVGGTGKTPLSIYIYNLLKQRKFNPAIVRKYYSSHFDEINLSKKKVKYFYTDKKRSISILKAEKKKNDIVIMDDGFQDVSIKRDLNIICFNSLDLVGNGFLLPAGPLRNQLKKLKNCQIVVINGKRNITFEKKLKTISSNIKIYQSIYKVKNIQKYKGKKIIAFAGIGNPESFFNLLKNYGLTVKVKISFPDHYQYSKDEVENIIRVAEEKKFKLLTTEKDFFRIKKLGLKKIDFVSIDLKIINNKNFEREVIKHL